TANSLSSQTSATAAAANILSGKTAYVNGSKITGTMANKGNLNWSGSNTTYTVPAGYYSGGTLNSKPSYTNGYNAGHKVINKNGWTTSSSSQYGFKQYDGSGASKYYLTIDMNYTHQILAAAIYTSGYSSKEFYLMTANGFSVKMNESMVIDMTKTHPNWATDRYFYIPVNGSGWSYHYDIWYL
ncbi:MAG TPA: hypothetical protein DCW90_17470, partial [Lachnospiraceae bacterium]|nr:hypothetical protein [Lachnospiraceae bacterium]